MTQTTTTRGFPVTCLACGERGTVRVSVDPIDTVHCSACDAEWTLDEAAASVAAWQALLAWLASAPPRPEE